MNKFDIFLPLDILTKDIDGSTKKRHVAVGTGSTVKKDRQGERLSEKALARLENIASEKRIPVFSDHNHSWENTMGFISSSKTNEGKWDVAIDLEDPESNSKVAMLISKKEHGTPIGLSIGGRVKDSHFDKSNGESVRVIDDLELFELSFVGIPANEDGSVISYIAKSLEGEEMAEEIKVEPVVAQPVVAEVQEPVVVKAVEEYASKKDLDEMKKNLVDEIAKQIASITPVKKSVVEDVSKDSEVLKEQPKEDKLDEVLKKRYNLR